MSAVRIEAGESEAAARAAIARSAREQVRTAVWVGEVGTPAYCEFEAEINGDRLSTGRRTT